MSSPHRIFGAEMSPYSVKVRSYFRYKGIPQQWIVRNMETQAEYQKYAKLPIDAVHLIGPKDRIRARLAAWKEAGRKGWVHTMNVSTTQPEALELLAEELL